MRKLIYILFIQLHVFFAHAGIFNDTTDRDRFIEEAVIALDEKYVHNLELEQNGSITAADYVVDIRNIKHRVVHKLEGVDLAALNAELASIKADHSNEGVAVYVLLSTYQPHLMTNATDGFTDNEYFFTYLTDVKLIKRDAWNSLAQPIVDEVWDAYKAELARITREIIDKSQLGRQTKKGALLHLFDRISISKTSPAVSSSVKMVYTPVIALGQDLKASSMQSMLAYINNRISSNAFSNPSKLYDPPIESTNGFINPYVGILKDAFEMLISDSFVADEYDASIDAMLLYYSQSNSTPFISKLNEFNYNNQTPIIKTTPDGATYTVEDYAGIVQANPTFFWDNFLKIADKNNGVSIREINGAVKKVNYYIIITSETNKKNEKVATQIVLEDPNLGNGADCIVMAMHFRNANVSADLQYQLYSRYSTNLQNKINSLREIQGYSWYQHNTTNEIVYGKYLGWEFGNGIGVKTNWTQLDAYKYTNPISGKVVYSQYTAQPLLATFLAFIERKSDDLNDYMIVNGQVVGEIVLEGAAVLVLAPPTLGGSLFYAGGRFIAYQAGTKVVKEVTKGVLIAYTINVGLNMLLTDQVVNTEEYYNEVFVKKIDGFNVLTAGIEEIFAGEGSQAIVNCVGGAGSASLKDNVKFLDVSNACLENVMMFYLTKRVSNSAGIILLGRLKAYAKSNPTKFIYKLKTYFKLSDDQVKLVYNQIGVDNTIVDNIKKFTLIAGKTFSKEASFLVGKSTSITNEVSDNTWKFYTTTAKNKVFAEINTNGDLIIKDFSTVNFTGSTDDIVRSAHYTNPSGEIETGDIAFVTNSNGTSGITKKVVSEVGKVLDEAFESIVSVQNLKKLSGVSVKQIDNVSLNQLKSLKTTNGIDELANVSTAEVSINKTLNKTDFSSHSGFDNFQSKIPNGSASPNQNTKIFTTGDAPTASGQMRPRHNDAEVKIFEDIASQLGAKKGDVGTKVFNDVEGKIKLKTELCPCGSCSGVIEQFKNMFPKVELEILAQPKVSF